MKQSPYVSNFVDHYLQTAILGQLAKTDHPLRFSEIKEDGIENSLFMYHMNKLIRRGIVEKTNDQRFSLTPKGAHWINFTGLGSATTLLPRPLVQLVIRSGKHLLLAKRTGQMSTLLNTYMLPGTVHEYGQTAETVATSYFATRFPARNPPLSYLTFVEVIIHDEIFIHHTLSSLFMLTNGMS